MLIAIYCESVIVCTAGDRKSSETSCTCTNELGIAVGGLLLAEGLVAIVIAIIVVVCWLITRYTEKLVVFTVLDSPTTLSTGEGN